MLNTETIIELLPHYVAMLVIVFATLALFRSIQGEIQFFVEIGIILGVVILYRLAATSLGVAPSSWEQ